VRYAIVAWLQKGSLVVIQNRNWPVFCFTQKRSRASLELGPADREI